MEHFFHWEEYRKSGELIQVATASHINCVLFALKVKSKYFLLSGKEEKFHMQHEEVFLRTYFFP